MAETHACTFFLAIDDNGNFVVDEESEEILGKLADHEGALAQVYQVTLHVQAAEALEVEATVPAPKGKPVKIEIKADEDGSEPDETD